MVRECAFTVLALGLSSQAIAGSTIAKTGTTELVQSTYTAHLDLDSCLGPSINLNHPSKHYFEMECSLDDVLLDSEDNGFFCGKTDGYAASPAPDNEIRTNYDFIRAKVGRLWLDRSRTEARIRVWMYWTQKPDFKSAPFAPGTGVDLTFSYCSRK